MPFVALDLLSSRGLAAFAEANGLQYQRRSRPPILSGGRFEQYTNAKVRGSVSGPGWLVGNLDVGDGVLRRQSTIFGVPVTWAYGSARPSRTIPPIGYLALTLSRQLPNMILDSKRNDSATGSSLVHPPSRDQRLSLEGDFDKHFDLFVPAGYEKDALYIFTPDLMALMIDETADFDVEIRGNQLVVYAPGGLDLSRADTWTWIERVRSVLGSKAYSRTARYSDARSSSSAIDAVAPLGQRLRRRVRLSERTPVVYSAAIITGILAAVLVVIVLTH